MSWEFYTFELPIHAQQRIVSVGWSFEQILDTRRGIPRDLVANPARTFRRMDGKPHCSTTDIQHTHVGLCMGTWNTAVGGLCQSQEGRSWAHKLPHKSHLRLALLDHLRY